MIRHSGILLCVLLLAGCMQSLPGSVDKDAAGGAGGALPPGAQFGTDEACPAPRCFDVEVPAPEGVVVTDNHVRVILPADYGKSGKRYPVLYLLHDAAGSYRIWSERTDVLELTRSLDLIVVMPDGGAGKDAGWYTNWIDGSRQWETFHIDVMMPFLEKNLDVLGDGHRAIAGVSMGGFGTMSYSGRHPGLFAAAAGISGAVDLLYLEQASALGVSVLNPVISTPNQNLWGSFLTNYPEWQAHDPGYNIEGFKGMKVFLSCGNGLPGGAHDDLTLPGNYLVENLVWQMNLSFERALTAAGVEHKTFFYGPGYHDYPYYRDELAWALPQLMSVISP